MRLAHHLLRHPSGVWHFRLIVPLDLQPLIGRKVIKKSLNTRDPVLARIWAYVLGARYAETFIAARGQGVRMGSDFEEYLKGLRSFEIRQGADGPEVRTDGTQRDNRDALDALTLIRDMEALRAKRALREGGSNGSVAPVPIVPARPRPIGMAVERWLKSIEADTLKKTFGIKTAAVMGFAQHVGVKKMLHEVQREDVHVWVEALRTSGLQTPTLINKTSYLRGFFTWAVAAGAYPKFPKDENPAAGHVIYRKQEKKKRKAFGFKAFTQQEIQRLYAPEALAQLSEGARWGAVIGLYTGARVSEVGQLALVDFTTVDGVPCMTITDEGEGQSVKNDPSLRTIPVHPDLISLGLLERVDRLRKQGEKRLFPKIKIGSVNGQGDWLSKAFGRHIEAVGIPKPAKGKFGFHSLRKTAIQTMKSSKVPLEWRCAYVGHDLDEEHVETYSGEYGPKDMLIAVEVGLHWGLRLVPLRAVLQP
jgi:integrase